MIRTLLSFLVAFVLIGCRSLDEDSPNCGEIEQLQSLVGMELTPAQMADWALHTFHATHSQVDPVVVTKDNKTSHFIMWKKAGTSYEAILTDSVVEEIMVYGSSRPASSLMECLGQPELYTASRSRHPKGHLLSISLLYPSQGVVANGARNGLLLPPVSPRVSGDFVMNSFRLIVSGTEDEMLEQIYASYPDELQEAKEEFAEWPGRWRDIEIRVESVFDP